MASDSDGLMADYSNFDPDGPFFSRYGEIYGDYYNYDVLAPGSNIMSTYPGGRYKFLSGTSMATPLVAGSVSRLLQVRGYDYAKDYGIYGDIAESKNQDGIFDVYMATTWTEENRKVALRLQSTRIVEVEGDMDGEIDAGEIIDIYPTIRSLWGRAENIKISARSDYNPNISANAVTFLTNSVDFGHVLNSQGSAASVNPIRFKVNEKVNDGYNLILYYTISCDNETDEETQTEKEVHYTIENGVELKGIISKDMTLYPDVHYIIRDVVGIAPGVTLSIKGGTVIKYSGSPSIRCEGTLACESSPDSMILVTSADYRAGILTIEIANGSMEYTKFQGVTKSKWSGSYNHCQFENVGTFGASSGASGYANNCTFYDDFIINHMDPHAFIYQHCNLIGNVEIYDHINHLCRTFYSNLLGRSFGAYSNTVCELKTSNYLGTSSNSMVEQLVLDINDNCGYGFVDPEHVRKVPYAEAHGCVWKILVDDFDVQDGYEAMDNAPEDYPTSPTNQNYELFPIGVGTHECKVYFNRPMDVSVNPTVTMGLRSPYTQTEMNPDGVWSADSLVYTTTFAISAKSNIDGVNRILVDDAEDNEHFKIPQESKRFNVLVQVSGSLSTGLVATAGLGNVQLDWETKDEDFADLMGYNVYRYTVDEQGISSDTIMMNDQLIEPGEIDETGTMTQSFTDYDVVPGITYYYIVKEIGTDLQSYDVSNPVAATPLTASLGDANGSMTVDIADVMTEIYYLTGENPKPFIFEAADVNCDQTVNILDVIGTINLITESAKTESISDNEIAHYYIDNGKLYVETPIALSGLQVQVKGNRSSSAISLSDELKGFETVNNWLSDSKYLLLCYSLSGMVFSPGKHFLLELGNETEISELILSDTAGHNVIAINDSAASIENLDQDLPFSSHGQIEYRIVDMYGRMVAKDAIQRGIYVVNVYVDGQVIKSYKLLQK